MTEQGRKFDGGKLRYDLVPVLTFEDIVKGLTFGATKYDDDNWKEVPNGRKRYLAAAMRHLQEYRKGNLWDEEQGIHHLSAAINNFSFIVEKDLQGWEDVQELKEVEKESVNLWYPDDSGDWVETLGLDFDDVETAIGDSLVEFLGDFERNSKSYVKTVNTFEWWMDGYTNFGNRVAYKIVK